MLLRGPDGERRPWLESCVGRLRLRQRLALVGLLFVVTGGVGLLAEQSFEKLLGLLLGTSTPAGAVVLGVYFAGLSIGALGYARWMRPRVPEPLRAYALLELGVAAWSLLLGLSFDRLVPAGAVLLRPGVDRFWLLQTLRGAVAALWILPPTVMMGATFPAIADHLERLRLPGRARLLNRFYALNLLGAFGGAVVGPYLAFPSLGVAGTLQLGALLDGFVAATALMLARGLLARRREAPSAASRGVQSASGSAVLIAVAGLSGLLFFALEVLWTHLIGAVLGNSVFAFAAMLANVLLGLLLGSILSTVLLPTRSLSPAAPALLFLFGACVLSLSMAAWCRVPHSLAVWGGSLTTFGQGELLRFLHAAFLLVPASVVLGMAYPALFRLSTFPASEWPVIAGRMAAANAAGCVAGALLAAFVLLPVLGSEASLLALAGAYTLSGLALGLVYLRGRARVGCVALAAAVLALSGTRQPWDLLKLTSGEHVYFGPGHVGPKSRLLSFHEDAGGGITSVVEGPPARPDGRPTRTLLTNGKFQGNDSGEVSAQIGFALTPILYVSHLDDALVIGLGTGTSAHVVKAAGFQNVDVAEIAPGIVEAATHFFGGINGDVLSDPSTRLHLEDGRNVLLLRERRYDLISMELTSVWFAGSTNLFSREFYELAASRLKAGGVLQQWIQIHHIGIGELRSALATIRAVFPEVSFWVVGGQGIFVASSEPQRIRSVGLGAIETLGPRLGWPPDALAERYRLLLASRLLSSADVTRAVATPHEQLNTDANRLFEYTTPRYNLDRRPLERMNLQALALLSSPPHFEVEPDVPARFAGLHATVDRALQKRVLEGR